MSVQPIAKPITPTPKKINSCDACRSRKVRCERLFQTEAPRPGPSVGQPSLPPCRQCADLGIECTTTWRPKRRGPPNEYLKKLMASDTDSQSHSVPVPVPMTTIPSLPDNASLSPVLHSPLNRYIPVSPLSARPTSHQPHSLEDIIERNVAMSIFALFFDYVHPLTPCLHRPTFLMEVQTMRDEKEPVFLALVLSVLASAMVQIPKPLLPTINNCPGREVADRCYHVSRLVSLNTYEPPTIEMVILRFLDSVYHIVSGRLGAHVLQLSNLPHVSVDAEMIDPISAEVRRRMFGLLFTSDKAAACLRNRPIFLPTEDCDTLMPKAVDDEYITRTEYRTFPVYETSTIAGFNIATRVFGIIGETLLLQRTVRRQSPLAPEDILARLRRVKAISEDLAEVLIDIPAALRLAETPAPLQLRTNIQDWGQDIFAQLDLYFAQPESSRSIAKESFLVLKGNIYVTHALARFVLIGCRDEIMGQTNSVGGVTRTATETIVTYLYDTLDRYETVIVDLLKALHSIPVQSLAVNGPSLVNKIRYVAVSLLDALDANNPVSPEGAYLLDFLAILSEIEQTL
ncbi:hypothetical protein CNBE5160 [Cryptococcus deneoformans B-3501A]|uniref:hypothetical protein n=1 Tax=Cryptococcus deneoformans (strain B-3501A) TaxID=283643 RepID=UPI000042EC29|nr:hypothetical protein CNBE5160 [Cryptococcus neoformans var. neoformans B-3501A]EAL20596.1 hypothetical protein CNBE5160 [Cryptococcus neoformans var. neoformans B-3501A]